ncbi:hypothetical protein KL938_002505 [Ogataea parapolymorpha]|nr:hypothetical protein KL938_002505 [Ogataea parapolymorpha]
MPLKLFRRKDDDDAASIHSGGSRASSKKLSDSESLTFDDTKTFQYSFNSNTNSLFSSKNTISTRSSSQQSSHGAQKHPTFTSIGKPLRVLNEEEFDDETEEAGAVASLRRPKEAGGTNRNTTLPTQVLEKDIDLLEGALEKQLRTLAQTVSNTLMRVSQSVLNLTKASIEISESIKQTTTAIAKLDYLAFLPPYHFSTASSPGLAQLIKNVLFLVDNLLVIEVYDNSKALVLKNLHDLLVQLKTVQKPPQELENYVALMAPQNFPVGSSSRPLESEQKIGRMMQLLVKKSKDNLLSDQDGSFIAPVLRGFVNENLSVVTFVFGFPTLTNEHTEIIRYFCASSADLHFVAQKNEIKPAASTFHAPFRTLDPDAGYVPISMPIACNSSLKLSGTLAGYLYPKISKNNEDTRLQKYANSLFGLTCAHVILNETINAGENYPYVSVPSPVLINLYKNALANERLKYEPHSEEYQAYDAAIRQLDETYPVSEVRVKKKLVKRNLPPQSFGQLIWGERLVVEDKLSDIAIVKISDHSKKFINFLGEDLELNKHDPSLMFSNLSVKETVDLESSKDFSTLKHAGLDVFKVGATTGYTDGRLNGQKMIYWSDGTLRTSEFVIAGSKKQFAAGGDSGAFILTKLSNLRASAAGRRSMFTTILGNLMSAGPETGLGVIGMLHSYDGENKEFGLLTPIHDILDRLHAVTGVRWGVVGCNNDDE